MEGISLLGEGPLFLGAYAARFFRVALLLSLWRMIFSHRGATSGMTLQAVLTYTLIAEVFAEALTPETDIDASLRDGSIAIRALRPVTLFAQYSLQVIGRFSVNALLFSAPLLVCAPLLGVSPFPASPANGVLFLGSFALAVSIGLALEFIFTALVILAGIELYQLRRIKAGVQALFSGALIPLALLPVGVGHILVLLPFASTASAPLRIYIGTAQAAPLLVLQLFWAALLWPLANGLWRRNRERLVCQGG